MEYTEIIYLIEQKIILDEIGNNISHPTTSKKCFAKKQSVRTNEFYNAVAIGFNPTIEFVVKKLNYNNEQELIWNNEKYAIIRIVEPKNKYDIVLVCEKKIGVNNAEK